MRRRAWARFRLWLRWCGAWLLWLSAAGLAGAHPILQNPVWIEVRPEGLRVRLYVSVRELGVVQGLPIGLDGTVDREQALEMAPRHSGYVLDHLDFRADGVPLAGTVEEIAPPGEIGAGPEAPDRAHFVWRLHYPFSRPPGLVTFSHTMVKEFPSAPGVDWDLSYAYRFGVPGEVPRVFGALPRLMTVAYRTGYAPVPPEAAALAGGWAGAGGGAGEGALLTPGVLQVEAGLRIRMLRLALLGAALGLGVTGRAGLRRMLGYSAGGFLAGWLVGGITDAGLPWFVPAALAGIGILLASVDNIHRTARPAGGKSRRSGAGGEGSEAMPAIPGTGSGREAGLGKAAESPAEDMMRRADGRRTVLALVFPAVAGFAAASAGSPGGLAAGSSGGGWNWLEPGLGLTVLAGGCLAGAGLVLPLLVAAGDRETGAEEEAAPGRPGWIAQVASLLVCVGGLAVLLDGLGIRPWVYWLEKLGR